MKYQDFEKGLNSMFSDSTEAVDIDMLITNLHRTPAKKRAVIWLWFGLFTALTVISLIGLNTIIENSHTEVVIDKSLMLTQKTTPTNTKSSRSTQNIEPSQQTIAILDNKKDTRIPDKANFEDKTSITKSNSTSRIVDTEKAQNITTRTTITNDILPNTFSKTNPIFTPQPKQQTNFTNNFIEKSNQNKLIRPESKLITALRPMESVSDLLDYERTLPNNDYVDCPTFSKKMKWHIDLIPEIGYIAPLKTLSINNSEPTEVFDMRTANETSLEGIQAALYTRITPGNAPYYLKFGASYTRLTERMNLNTSYTVSDTTVGIISITESQNGDTLTVIRGDIITDSTFTRVSKDHYSLQLIDIPVAIGISKSIGNGWRVGGELGAQFNISMTTKGKLLESTGQNSYTDLPASGRFSPNVGISFFAGLTLEKAVSRNSSFYISPRFRYFPKSFTPDSYGVRQEYQFVGLHAGYIFSF